MMSFYYVKDDLFGLRRGRVERFHPAKAGQLVLEGKIEPYDPKRHCDKPGAPKQETSPKK